MAELRRLSGEGKPFLHSRAIIVSRVSIAYGKPPSWHPNPGDISASLLRLEVAAQKTQMKALDAVIHILRKSPPLKRLEVGSSSSLMRFAEHLTALRASRLVQATSATASPEYVVALAEWYRRESSERMPLVYIIYPAESSLLRSFGKITRRVYWA